MHSQQLCFQTVERAQTAEMETILREDTHLLSAGWARHCREHPSDSENCAVPTGEKVQSGGQHGSTLIDQYITSRLSRLVAMKGYSQYSTNEGMSTRFVLYWETDANDVDFHIRDGRGGHAFFGSRHLSSGGALYADITTGYGPECFTVRGAAGSLAYPYSLQAHYYGM